jgi:hypothetical protein
MGCNVFHCWGYIHQLDAFGLLFPSSLLTNILETSQILHTVDFDSVARGLLRHRRAPAKDQVPNPGAERDGEHDPAVVGHENEPGVGQQQKQPLVRLPTSIQALWFMRQGGKLT